MPRSTSPSLVVALIAAFAVGGCAREPRYPATLEGSSQTHVDRGEYAPIELDRVEGLAIEDGRLLVRGAQDTITLDLPAGAEPDRPSRNWALVTERVVGTRRELTFTHSQSLAEFTIELPGTEGPFRYGVLSRRSGGEVMILAWSAGSASFQGHAIIEARR